MKTNTAPRVLDSEYTVELAEFSVDQVLKDVDPDYRAMLATLRELRELFREFRKESEPAQPARPKPIPCEACGEGIPHKPGCARAIAVCFPDLSAYRSDGAS